MRSIAADSVCDACSYCASRVLKYDKAGQLIGLFGVGDSQIPHSVALAEELDLLCVADRENMRYHLTQCSLYCRYSRRVV